MRRKEYEASVEEGLELIDRAPYAVLSMIDPNGEPYAVPINVVREGQTLYFHGALVGKKAECLAAHPNVSVVCVGDWSLARFTVLYESVVAEGIASPVTEDNQKRAALRLLSERFSPADMDRFEAAVFRVDRVGVWRIDLTAVSAKQKPKKA